MKYKKSHFRGFPRSDGKAGIRNRVAVIATCVCSAAAASQIAGNFDDVDAVVHAYGCGVGPQDTQTTLKILTGMATNPNVGAVLLVGLGCETVQVNTLLPDIKNSGRPVESLVIQEAGGSAATVQKGRAMVEEMRQELLWQKREDVPLSKLVVGLECGGSDALSGVTANPAVGLVSDWLVENGATVILAETTEMIGAGEVLAGRAVNRQVAEQLTGNIRRVEQEVRKSLGPLASRVIAPGNMDGGISTITEKSLGCITKGGSTPVNEVLGYGEAPSRAGLVVMDTPGFDVESMAGLAAGGSQVILFTTGRGTPVGFPLVPVIKVASNPVTYRKMPGDIDINAGVIVEKGWSLASASQEIWEFLMRVLNGEKTRAEHNRQSVFGFLKQGMSL
jgi:altronate dehydratase large subunit